MRWFRSTCIFLSLALLAGGMAQASNFEISPVVLELTGTRMAGTIKITNKDDHAISLQVRPYDWTQVDSKDELNASQTLAISPPLFTIAPGASQIVRVVSKKAATTNETSYRMLVDEIPTATGESAISFKFRISMPVFVQTEAVPTPKYSWAISAGKTPKLSVQNQGNRRARLLNLTLTLPNGKKVLPNAGANPYTLTGVTRQYPFEVDTALLPGMVVKLSATTDAGPIEVDIPVTP